MMLAIRYSLLAVPVKRWMLQNVAVIIPTK